MIESVPDGAISSPGGGGGVGPPVTPGGGGTPGPGGGGAPPGCGGGGGGGKAGVCDDENGKLEILTIERRKISSAEACIRMSHIVTHVTTFISIFI